MTRDEGGYVIRQPSFAFVGYEPGLPELEPGAERLLGAR